MKSIKNIITHSGTFHADDVFAVAIMHSLHPDAKIIRTRDEKLMEDLASESSILDVGRKYDPSQKFYDHHQPDAPKRENGDPYSAFGMVWKHHGKEWLEKNHGISGEKAEKLHQSMEKDYVVPCDKVDNGMISSEFALSFSLAGVIYAMNPSSLDMDGKTRAVPNKKMDEAFSRAVVMASSFITQESRNRVRELNATDRVNDMINNRDNKKVLIMDENLPFEDAVKKNKNAKDILLIVAPNSGGDWGVSCAPGEEIFTSRRLLPASWRGKVNEDLEQASGVKGATFCHAKQFFAATKDKESAVNFAQKAVEIWERQDKYNAKNNAQKE